MEKTFSCILLLLSLNATSGKYVYIKNGMTWEDAQKHCQKFYTDLAPAATKRISDQLCDIAGCTTHFIWIGLHKDFTLKKKWMWSGGGEVSTFFWGPSQPTNKSGEDYGAIHNYGWYDLLGRGNLSFFCYSVVVVREKKTWEGALEYCRNNHRDLASVLSEAESLLIQAELGKNAITQYVWTGLRFISENWLWVDGQPLSYEAWGEDGKPECPDVKLKCGALKVTNGAQCKKKVGNNETGVDVWLNMTGECGVGVGVLQSVWDPYNCEEKLHFICH